MTLQQLTYAVEVYKCGSISKAAQNLYMAQPNLSTAIRELESELGYLLFCRMPKGVQVTENGEDFLRQANDIVSRVQLLEIQKRAKNRQVSTLSLITARSSEICIKMTRFINELNQEGLPFRVKMRESTNHDVINDVVSGDADIGIVRANTLDADYFFRMVEYRGLQLIRLPPDPYVVLFSENHPLAAKDYITKDMLTPFIEVVHGDYERPMYPFSEHKYKESRTEELKRRLLFVYDRGSLMDVLANVHGSYIWTTTTHQILKDTYKLVERQCDAAPVEGVDAIIYDNRRFVTPEMNRFIEILQEKGRKI